MAFPEFNNKFLEKKPLNYKTKNIEIVMYDNRKLNLDQDNYYTLASIINKNYADRHGYNFSFTNKLTNKKDPKNDITCVHKIHGERAASWYKILVLKKECYHLELNIIVGWILMLFLLIKK